MMMSSTHICIFALLVAGCASSELTQKDATVSLHNKLDTRFSEKQSVIKNLLNQVQRMADKRVQGKQPTDGDVSAMNMIQDIVTNQLLPSVTAIKDDGQNQLNEYHAAIGTCNDNSTAYHNAIGGASGVESRVNATRVEHVNCRNEEGSRLTAMSAATSDLDTYIKGLPRFPERFETNSDLLSDVTAALDYLHQIETLTCVPGLHQQCLNRKNAFDNTTGDHATAKAGCDGYQSGFEENYCAWRLELLEACNQLTNCYTTSVAAYSGRRTATQGLETQWKSEYTGLKRIECYVNIWMSDNDSSTVNDAYLQCDNQDVDTSPMDITYPTEPAQRACEIEKTAVHPCSEAFLAAEYGAFAATIADCVPCTPVPGAIGEQAANSDSSCATVDGDPCVFPVLYREVTYNSCTSAGYVADWCATSTDENGVMGKNQWGTCADSCYSA